MSVLYLARHAHADWLPDEQRPLSARGLADAERLAELLQAKPIAALYSSPAYRAYQTIAPLAARLNLPIQQVRDLRERELSATSVPNFLEAVHRTWQEPEFAFPGGESNRMAQHRGIQVVAGLVGRHPNDHIVVSTHGNLLALILQHYDSSIDVAFWQALTMPDVYQVYMDSEYIHTIERLWL